MRYIRDKFGDVIYCIRDDGIITDKFDCDVVGHWKGDRITDKFDINTLFRIRSDGTITDKYDCDVIGHIREDGSITDEYDLNTHGSVDGPDLSSPSSGTGCLSSLFSLVVVIITALIRLLLPVLKIFFLGFWLPALVETSWVGLLSGFLMVGSASIGLIPLAVLFGLFAGLIALSFFPYWAVLMWKKIKKLLTWKEIVRYYGIWFLNGPFAYHILKAEILTKKECVDET